MKDGRLVVGEKHIAAMQKDPVPDDDQLVVDLSRMHPALQSGGVKKMFVDGHRAAAILEAFKLVATRVKDLTGLEEDGARLMSTAFHRDRPRLRLNTGMSRSDRDEQEGFMHIFMGAMLGIRNPKAHDPFIEPDVDRALDYLAVASLLLRRLDDAKVDST